MSLLQATARCGNFEVLEILLKRQNADLVLRYNKMRIIRNWWGKVIERNQGDKGRLENSFKHFLQWDCKCLAVGDTEKIRKLA
jgi:hypothetical protein